MRNLQAWLIQLYYKFSTYQAGLVKHSLQVTTEGTATFSYSEKGNRIDRQPTVVFVHGLSSNKETWLSIIKNIPENYHCIAIDLPAHGETVGLNEEHYSIDKFVEALKLFFDLKNLTSPICLVGASMGGAIVSMFALKYPSCVSMICLLAPPANEEYETDLVQRLRSGIYSALLPETPEQLYEMIDKLTIKKINLPWPILNGFLHLRLRLLEEHKKVLSSLLEYDYPHLDVSYQKLRQLDKPALILWGRHDRVYTAAGADYFMKLLPKAEKKILEDCGHFMAIDKPDETAKCIVTFLDTHLNDNVKELVTHLID
ncbi:hypothetical protein I4U23_004534 [Adineta vaga]|nr:hypothetical protein I4U23_004534 [Adineta vaga]